MNIYQKLSKLQSELKCPKSQFNSFGKYKFRNCEDIMEAAKPLLLSYSLTVTMSDDIINIGDRFYVKATATLVNAEKPDEIIYASAFAREALTKKGMDDSQITGTASSYARKYCLNGLYAIDDTKDADSMENQDNKQSKQIIIGQDNINWLSRFCKTHDIKDKQILMSKYSFDPYGTTAEQFDPIKITMESDYQKATT